MTAIAHCTQYKFDVGTNQYDTSEKQRVPAWTDRILVNSTSAKFPISFGRYEAQPDMLLSDHKPVFGVLSIDLSQRKDGDGRDSVADTEVNTKAERVKTWLGKTDRGQHVDVQQ